MNKPTVSPNRKMLLKGVASLSTIALLFSGCAPTRSDKTAINPNEASCFDVTADGKTIHLLFGQSLGEKKGVDLFWKRLNEAQEWSEPLRIPTDHASAGNHHRGNDPQVAAYGDHLMALWTAKGGGPYGSGKIATAISSDGGKTWQAGPSPATADPRSDVGYRFPATAADDKAFHVVWIHAEDKERSLRYSRLEFGAKEWSKPFTIDSTSCACCWNELKVGSKGELFVLYRDDEPKDMALAVSKDSGQSWENRSHVGTFNWQFDGCPHVGGGMALAPLSEGKTALFATVWTGATEGSGAYSLVSVDDGKSWGPMARLVSAGENGRHTDAAATSANDAMIAWDYQSEDEQAVCLAATSDGGKSWSEPSRISEKGKRAGYPRLITAGDRFFLFWSEYGHEKEQPKLRMQLIAQVQLP